MIDDAVDMLGELPANLVNRILRHTSPNTRSLINQFLLYPEFGAGSIMTAEFVQLKKEMTVKEAIDHIRRVGEDKETIYTCYVTTQNRKLEGIISVRTLLFSDDESILESVMDRDFISVTTTDDQELVADLFRRYDLLSIPVVDHENRLVGIITKTDLLEVLLTALGMSEDSSRLSLLVRDRIGVLAEVAGCMQRSEINIRSVMIVPLPGHEGIWQLILRVAMTAAAKAAEALQEAGFKVVTRYVEDLTPYLPDPA